MHAQVRLGLALFAAFAASCSGGDRRLEFPSGPTVVRFDADATTVAPGGSVTLTYEVKDANLVRIEPGLLAGSTMLAGTVQSGPLTETTTFTLTATSAYGAANASVTVTVVAAADVRIARFEAMPQVVAPGASTTLSWATENATSVRLTDAGGAVLLDSAPTTGTFVATPSIRTTYVLTAEGPNGPATATVEVLVGERPKVDSFEAMPQTIVAGGMATLSWRVTGANDVTIQDAANNVIVMNGALTGMVDVSPAATTTYTLVANASAGNATATVNVTVVPAGSPLIDTFTVTPQMLSAAGDVTITWATTNADTVELLANTVAVPTFPRTPSGTMTLTVASTTDLLLRATNTMDSVEDSITVVVGAADTTAPSITHTPVTDGQAEGAAVVVSAEIVDAETGVASATLFYRAQGAGTFASVTLADIGSSRYEASIPATGIVPPAVEYYIQANDIAGNSAVDPAGAPASFHTFTVTPDDQAAPTITHTPVPQDRTQGQAVTVTADVTDASGVASVTLYYKRQADALYTSAPMTAAGNTYSASIPAATVVAPGVDYYIEASDVRTPANVGLSPSTAPGTPHSFSVLVPDTAAPTITHTPIPNGQTAGVAIAVTANVVDATGVASVTLFYRGSGGGAFTSVAMTASGATYSAQIPAGAVAMPSMSYYIQATDTAPGANVGRFPAMAPGTPQTFTVSPADVAAPTITHTPVTGGQAPGAAVAIVANVTDGSGVASVTLFYRTVGGTFTSIAMTGGPSYSANIPGAVVQGAGVEYYLQAVDASPNANVATSPTYTFSVGIAEVEPNNTPATATSLLTPTRLAAIGLGAVTPASDVDYWAIDVPTGPDRYTMSFEVTFGGAGACPAPIDTVLRLYDTNGTTVLVTDDFDGQGSCSFINPVVDSGARALPAGRYYVSVVENGSNATIAGYELRASMAPAACGNGILETPAAEQCDDGNTTAGDGCNATCQIEPEGTFTAPGGTQTGDINPAGETDLFAVVVGPNQFVTANITNGTPTGCPGDLVLELFGPNGVTLLGGDDNDGNGACPRIDPLTDAFVQSMAAGTYFLRVRGASTIDVINGYSLQVTIADGVCGNASVESNEQCDDGNATDFDGCSSTCQYETTGVATGAGGSFTDAINPIGNVDFYEIVVPAGYSIRAETFAPMSGVCDSAWDTVIRLYAPDRTTQLVSDDEGGLNHCSVIDPATDAAARGLPAGTYWLSVEDWLNNSAIPAYVLDIQIVAPSCGDGFISGTEQCDDGGVVAGDGCSATCTLEGANVEAEPNDVIANATVMGTTMVGALSSPTDLDLYRVTVGSVSSLLATVSDGNGGCPADTTLRLLNSTGTVLVTDSSDGPGSCGRISPGGDAAARGLAAGTYYLEVSGSGAGPAYQLDAALFTPGCGDLYLDVGESCDDGDVAAGDGCSATCTFELMELEPNDTATAAQALTSRLISGSIGVANESDWYSITVGANASMEIATSLGAPDQCSVDTVVTVFDATGTVEIAEDDLDGPNLCSFLERTEVNGLAAGTYLIRVEAFSSTATFPYVLTVDVY